MNNTDSVMQDFFNNTKSTITQNISKGIVSDAFAYSNAIKISKSGKEIKKGFEQALKACQEEKDTLSKSMNEALSKCSIVPTQMPSSYLFGPYKSKFTVIPKMFSWKEISSLRKNNNQPQYVESVVEKSSESINVNEQCQCCEAYNDACRQYIKKCKEVFLINTIINGIEDNKKYELSTEQAGLLGF